MATITLNQEHNGIEIAFEEIPTASTRDELKSHGFRWHNVKKVWYAKQSDETLSFANTLSEIKENKAFKFNVKVGDLFYASWGYEQTNIDFFQVVELIGASSVRVRAVSPRRVQEDAVSGMSCMVSFDLTGEMLPVVNSSFIKDNERGDVKRLKTYMLDGSDPHFAISSYAEAYKYDGQALYESWYY